MLMMIAIISLIGLIGLLGGMIMGSEASGDRIVFYVAQDGNDTKAGTEAEPFATLEYARSQLPPPEVVACNCCT